MEEVGYAVSMTPRSYKPLVYRVAKVPSKLMLVKGTAGMGSDGDDGPVARAAKQERIATRADRERCQ